MGLTFYEWALILSIIPIAVILFVVIVLVVDLYETIIDNIFYHDR